MDPQHNDTPTSTLHVQNKLLSFASYQLVRFIFPQELKPQINLSDVVYPDATGPNHWFLSTAFEAESPNDLPHLLVLHLTFVLLACQT